MSDEPSTTPPPVASPAPAAPEKPASKPRAKAKAKPRKAASQVVVTEEKTGPAPRLKVKGGSYVIENGDFVHLDKGGAR